MSPGRELPVNQSQSNSAPAGVTDAANNNFLEMLDVTKETNSLLTELNRNSKNSSPSDIPPVNAGKMEAAKSTDDVLKMHPIYLNTYEFSQPTESAPLLGKIPRNSFSFDVIIEGAATPSNFYVRNYRTSKALEILQNKMSDYYTNTYRQESLHMDNLMLNGYYVLKKDSKHFRVRIVRPFNRKGDLVMVELLDYGGFVQVQSNQLFPLKKVFAEYLPTQSWKAKLQVPHWSPMIKWSPEECVRFKNEYEGKSLVALILGESMDDLTNERCLGCLLVDTSGTKDMYIHLQFSDNKNK